MDNVRPKPSSISFIYEIICLKTSDDRNKGNRVCKLPFNFFFFEIWKYFNKIFVRLFFSVINIKLMKIVFFLSLTRNKKTHSCITCRDMCKAIRLREENHVPYFPYFLPSPFLTCCAILPTSFGGKGPHLRRWLVAQPLHQTVS